MGMGKTCIPKSKFFPLRVDPMLVGLRPLWETRKPKKVIPLCEIGERMGVHPNIKGDCQLFDKHVICSRIISCYYAFFFFFFFFFFSSY